MKIIVFTILSIFIMCAMQAQDVTKVGRLVEVKEGADKTEVILLNDRIHIEDNYTGDTTHIRIGKRKLEIIETDGQTNINVHRDVHFEDENDEKKRKKFNGHWAAFEMELN